jgi:hypothetical protein
VLISNIVYQVAAYNSATSLTLATGAGTQTAAPFSTFGTNSVTPSYSTSTPNVMYAQQGTQVAKYDFTGFGPSAAAPTPTLFYDFASSANCLGPGYIPTWEDHVSNSKYPTADTYFSEAFSNTGGQDTGVDVVVYKAGAGCVHYNTATGAITGDWGSTGTAVINGGAGSDRFKVHNAIVSKNGQWALISIGACVSNCGISTSAQYFWQIGTTTVLYGCTVAAGDKCGGHWTEGSLNQVNQSGVNTYGDEIRALAGAPNPPTNTKAGIATCSAAGFGLHMGWANADSLDTLPYYEYTTSSTQVGTSISPFSCPFLYEINLVSPAGVGSPTANSGKVWREAHTFNSGKQVNLFSCRYNVGAVSPDGYIAAWESDGEGAFGSTSGGSSCSGTTCRCEVLGMILQ